MVKEGVADISKEIEVAEKVDEEMKKRVSCQSIQEDPVTEEKSRNNLYIITGVFVVCFLLLFAFTLIRKEEITTVQDMTGKAVKGIIDQRYHYNGFNFVKVDDIWYTELLYQNNKLNIPLHYGPREVENVTLLGEVDTRFTDAKLIYIAFNPLDNNLTYVALANGELSLSLARGMGLNLKAACTQNQTYPCAKQPILSCSSDTERAIIELRQDPETSVQYRGNCILITGQDWDLVKAVDRLLLRWYGIMP